jgi:hypothetical protein
LTLAFALFSNYLKQHESNPIERIAKNTKTQFIKEQNAIQKMKYPSVLSKKSERDEYLACTMRSCFAEGKELKI